MSEWIDVWLYGAFAMWTLAMLALCRYYFGRIRLKKTLGLIKTTRKKKKKLSDEWKERIFRWSNTLAPLGRRFRIFSNEKEMERKIALAGAPGGLNVDSFYGFRFLCMFLGLLFGTLLSYIGLGGGLMQILFFLAGMFFPILWIRSAANSRQEQIGIELPDFMDSMSVTLQAGVPLDPAMKQIVDDMEGPLGEELTRFQQELDIGVPGKKRIRG
ncbi:hypothetical protein N6H14_33680 [Paenibacillus sp. CC-CFT747]|nr:hypothetical protein N6H14_33680 [Paenibacillus sp. CC-CFT747]